MTVIRRYPQGRPGMRRFVEEDATWLEADDRIAIRVKGSGVVKKAELTVGVIGYDQATRTPKPPLPPPLPPDMPDAPVGVNISERSGTGSTIVARPSGTQPGDRLLASIQHGNTSSNHGYVDVPPGWTQVGPRLQAGTSAALVDRVFRNFTYVATAGDPSTWNFGWPGTNALYVAICAAVRSVEGGGTPPILDFSSASGATTPSLTLPGPALLVASAATYSFNYPSTPSGMTYWMQGSASHHRSAMARQTVSAGPTGTRSWSHGYASFLVAIGGGV